MGLPPIIQGAFAYWLFHTVTSATLTPRVSVSVQSAVMLVVVVLAVLVLRTAGRNDESTISLPVMAGVALFATVVALAGFDTVFPNAPSAGFDMPAYLTVPAAAIGTSVVLRWIIRWNTDRTEPAPV